MLKKHFFMSCPLFSFTSAIVVTVLLLISFVFHCVSAPVSVADDTVVTGEYVFEKDKTVLVPNAFISLNPDADTILFESGAVVETDVPFDLENLREQWQKWHRETGSDPARADEYDLKPLSAITAGNEYHKIILSPRAQIVNWTDLGDGLMTLGSGELDIGRRAMIHGRWAGISLANYEEPSDDEFFTISLTNEGRIGFYVEDVITGPSEDPPYERPARFGILVYDGVEGSIVNKTDGIIKGEHTGILTNYRETDKDAPYVVPGYGGADPIQSAPGRTFVLDNYGEIIGELYGVYEGGRYEDVSIVNHKTGRIEGGYAGIYLLRGGDIVNHGSIESDDVGIFVSSGTAEITNFGRFSFRGDSLGDAIRFGRDAVGGTVNLYSTVDGGIAHFGETEEAIVFLENAGSASVGNIYINEGAIIQNAGTWTLGNAAAASMSVEGGRMHLGEEVKIDQDIDIQKGATLNVTGGSVTARNIFNRGRLDFHDGEIVINDGVFDHSNDGGARDFTLAGDKTGQNPHLRLISNAGTAGIDTLSIGGRRAGQLTVEKDAAVSFQDRLEVNNQGRLAGTGTVGGSVVANSGGTLAPGHEWDSTGTLFIDGDLNIGKGAVVDIGIGAGDNNNARINVSGDVTIDGGTVQVTDLSGFRVQGDTSYTFLTTDSTLNGTFDAIHSFSKVYEVDLDYWPTGASFSLTRLANFDEYVQSQNQVRTLEALEAAWDEGHLDVLRYRMDWMLDRVLADRTPVAHLQIALASLDPEPYQASFRITADQVGQMSRHLMHGARQSRQKLVTGTPEELAAMMRASTAPPGTAGYLGSETPETAAESGKTLSWVHPGYQGTSTYNSPVRLFYGGFYRFADVDEVAGRTGYDYKNRGFYLGLERPRCSRIISGVSTAYTYNFARFDNDRGKLRIDSFRLGPHATYTRGNLEFDMALSGGVHLARQVREMVYPVPEAAVSRFNLYDGSAYTDLRYTLKVRDVWRIVPSAGLHYIYQYREGLKENRAEDINLKIDKDTFETLRGTAGLNLKREVRGSSFVLVPELFAGYRYDLLDMDVDLEGVFVNAGRSADQVIRVTGKGPDRDTTVFGAGITALFGEYNVLYAGYEQEITGSGSVETWSAGVKWNF